MICDRCKMKLLPEDIGYSIFFGGLHRVIVCDNCRREYETTVREAKKKWWADGKSEKSEKRKDKQSG